MEPSLNPEIALSNVDPEVKSYIYQSIVEFEPFITKQTVISVLARDPLRLVYQLEADGVSYDRKELKKMNRISISLTEDGNKLEEEGVHLDIFEAIKIAKNRLLKTLTEIQDSVVSNQDRAIQINTVRQNGSVH